MRRILVVLVLVASATGVLGATPAGAAGVLEVSASTVAAGGVLEVEATGCEQVGGDDMSYRSPEVVLVTGTGADERLASVGVEREQGGIVLTVPGWVEPGTPTVVAGSCREMRYDDAGVTTTTVFTYADVAVEIGPALPGAVSPVATLHADELAGGQVVRVQVSGCPTGSDAQVMLVEGTDRSGRAPLSVLALEWAEVVGPTFAVDLPLVTRAGDPFQPGTVGGPVPEGGYTVVAYCVRWSEDDVAVHLAPPVALTVTGTNPSGEIAVHQVGDSSLEVAGSGCTGGRAVRVAFRGDAYGDGFGDQFGAPVASGAVGVAQAVRRRPPARIAPDVRGAFEEVLEVVPEPDGTWSVPWSAPDSSYDVEVVADCGDPTVDGFRYVPQHWSEYRFSELWLARVSPTSSPTGGPVTAHFDGDCEGSATARMTTGDGDVVQEVPLPAPDSHGMTRAVLTAPSAPGTYGIASTCDGDGGWAQPYEVFTPTAMAAPAPLPPDPVDGWPSTGERETYHGRIGPIRLPAADDMDMDMDMDMGTGAGAGGRDLGPSALFIDVPRPDGDFAIDHVAFDLVDEHGMPVSQDDAHLHHFVITNTSSRSPSCPGSTFGLPGEIVGAAGAERTVLDVAEPYGVVVEDTDRWTGVYELMSRSAEERTVYLTYDLEIRRDVQNVRPLRTYFGSATGCGTFTWTVDGSGTPDTQSHHVTVADDGVLVGAGGHLHNGGLHTDLVDDRGRRLCRNEIHFGDGPGHGHGAPMAARRARSDEMTATTVVTSDDGTEQWGFPPEYYDDDPAIEGITTCALREQLTKGQRLRFDATYDNLRPRSGVMGIYTFYVWEGGGPATPGAGPVDPVDPVDPGSPAVVGGAGTGIRPAVGARPVSGRPWYTG